MRDLYPGYDVLAKRHTPSWNEQTRAVVDKRLHQVPDRRFFTETEWAILSAVCYGVCATSAAALGSYMPAFLGFVTMMMTPFVARMVALPQG